MRILVVEDEKDLNAVITKKLTLEGYSVDSSFDGKDALDLLSYTEYDGVVLDIMLPRKNGFEVVEIMRKKKDPTPVLFLTARDAIADRVKGLDSGGDDYLVKPFSFDELLARIRVMLRRKTNNATNIFTAADLKLDNTTHTVSRNSKEIELTAKEFSLLEYLMQNKGVVLSREKIENHIWNFDYEGGTNVVDVYIRYLRKKIDDGYKQKLIHTVRGVGYVLREK